MTSQRAAGTVHPLRVWKRASGERTVVAVGIAFRVDDPEGVSLSVWTDPLTPDAAMQHIEDLAATPAWGAAGRILTDLSGLSSESRPARPLIFELSEQFEKHVGDRMHAARWAVLANVAFDDAAEFASRVRPTVRDIAVFFDLASACIWLGVDIAVVRPVLLELRREAREAGA